MIHVIWYKDYDYAGVSLVDGPKISKEEFEALRKEYRTFVGKSAANFERYFPKEVEQPENNDTRMFASWLCATHKAFTLVEPGVMKL